ncbi:MAG: PEP-CTERM sorting domain-containing protein [Roseivivax sp.]|nr:PEP-CTERM sorting domain-containing protein [Roseivivax sp.]
MLVAATSAAEAAVMTFGNVGPDPFLTSYTEDGITATAPVNQDLYLISPHLHLDNGGSPHADRATFSMAGAFDAVSFLLEPNGFAYEMCDTNQCNSFSYPSFPNVLVQGYRGASLVASLLFDMGKGTTPYTVSLGTPFANLSSLTIGVVYPAPNPLGQCVDSPCSHFSVDDVTLAPVPVPATAGLAGLGLVLLGAAGWRRKKTHAEG